MPCRCIARKKIFAREGIDLSRQTMGGWMIQLEEKLTPLMTAMKRILYEGRVIHIDETRLQVLQEPGRTPQQQSFMWVYVGGTPERPVVWFQYADTRSAQVPRQFLAPNETGSPGGADPPSGHFYILTDGYAAYNALAREPQILGHAACWAHIRRTFVEAAKGRKDTATWSCTTTGPRTPPDRSWWAGRLVYALAFFDLEKDGPIVVEVPKGSGPGIVNDAFFRFVIDTVAPGPDNGKGGKYLLLPPEYDGPLEAPIGGKEQDDEVNGSTRNGSLVRLNWLNELEIEEIQKEFTCA